MKRLLLIMTALTLALGLSGCALLERTDATPTRDPDAQNPVATITMESGAVMTAELYPEYAPNTVANFIELANSGFYDGIKFHRVVKDFVIQAGMASTAGRDELDYSISGEFSSNGFEGNTLKHVKGVLSMARTDEFDSAGSQFFIVVADAPDYLDGEYAAFGALVDDESIAAADKISKVAVNSSSVPINDQTIASIRVETFGQEYIVQKLQ